MALAPSSLITSCNFGRDVHFKATKNTTLKPVIKPFPQRTKVALSTEEPVIIRRSGDYQPCIWDYNFLQSLKTDYTGQGYNARASELKEDVKLIFKNVVDPLDQLELIDHLQRLGLAYHFEGETKQTLEELQNSNPAKNDLWEKNLHVTALKFRLLREHGYLTSSGVSEEVARAHMIDLMKKKWEKMTKCRLNSGDIPLHWSSIEIILNMVRMSHCTYNSGADGYGVEDGASKQRMFWLFTEPIPLPQDTAIAKTLN